MSLGDRLTWCLVTGCGLGLAPVASGTFGTFGGVAVALLLQLWLSGGALAIGLAVAAAALLGYGCSLSGWTARVLRAKDPKPFVLDEIVGYLVTVALLTALSGDPSPAGHAAAFLSFRLFDVWKPFPARRLEHIPGAPGIMLDDVAAGVWAGLVLLPLPWLGIELVNP